MDVRLAMNSLCGVGLKNLTPKQVLVAGPLGLFLACFVPCAMAWGISAGLWMATLVAAALFPWMLCLAWAAHKPNFVGDPVDLDKHYRTLERYNAIATMACLGYLICYMLEFDSAMAAPGRWSMVCGIFAIVSLYVVGCGAALKIGLVARLKAIEELRKGTEE